MIRLRLNVTIEVPRQYKHEDLTWSNMTPEDSTESIKGFIKKIIVKCIAKPQAERLI